MQCLFCSGVECKFLSQVKDLNLSILITEHEMEHKINGYIVLAPAVLSVVMHILGKRSAEIKCKAPPLPS